jgi:hypothetical protein
MSRSFTESRHLAIVNSLKCLARLRAHPLQPGAGMRTIVMWLLVAAGSGCTASSSTTNTPVSPPSCGGEAAVATATVQRPADPPTEFRIRRCQVDADACLDLCNFVEGNNSSFGGQIVSCTAAFEGASQVTLAITYDAECASPPGFGGGSVGAGGGGGGGAVLIDAGAGV